MMSCTAKFVLYYVLFSQRTVITGEMRNAYKIFIGKHHCKRTLGRPRHRLENNIKIDLGEIVWEGVD